LFQENSRDELQELKSKYNHQVKLVSIRVNTYIFINKRGKKAKDVNPDTDLGILHDLDERLKDSVQLMKQFK
jgi:hypothetical protein